MSFLKELIKTKEKVSQRHKSGSLTGFLNITNSRLVKALEQCLHNLAENVDGAEDVIKLMKADMKSGSSEQQDTTLRL